MPYYSTNPLDRIEERRQRRRAGLLSAQDVAPPLTGPLAGDDGGGNRGGQGDPNAGPNDPGSIRDGKSDKGFIDGMMSFGPNALGTLTGIGAVTGAMKGSLDPKNESLSVFGAIRDSLFGDRSESAFDAPGFSPEGMKGMGFDRDNDSAHGYDGESDPSFSDWGGGMSWGGDPDGFGGKSGNDGKDGRDGGESNPSGPSGGAGPGGPSGPSGSAGPSGSNTDGRGASGTQGTDSNDGRGGASGDAGSCFITTAAVEHGGEADDGDTLSTLRRFRDDVMMTTAEGRREVAEYEALAPRVVQALSQRQDAPDVYDMLLTTYIKPAAEMVEFGDYVGAHDLYRHMIEVAATIAEDVPDGAMGDEGDGGGGGDDAEALDEPEILPFSAYQPPQTQGQAPRRGGLLPGGVW